MTNLFRLPYTYIRPLYEKTDFHRKVISEVRDAHLRESYNRCRGITSRYAKTFYMATRFLPYEKQRSIFAIYGFCRYLDNLVDDAVDLIEKRVVPREEILVKFHETESEIIALYNGEKCVHPILSAFSDTVKRWSIPRNLPLELLNGIKRDLFKSRYNDFEELYDYSYSVASVVGLMSCRVFEYHDHAALDHAVELGIAMQLTNILRDVGEDLNRNRIYLPKSELEQFGITENKLFERRCDETFKNFMRLQIKRAWYYFKSAESGIPMLSKDSRLPVLLAKENYSRILNKIEDNDYQVFSTRAYLNTAEKLAILPKVVLQL